jgi:hypothetical protein
LFRASLIEFVSSWVLYAEVFMFINKLIFVLIQMLIVGLVSAQQPSLMADFEIRLRQMENELAERGRQFDEAVFRIGNMSIEIERLKTQLDYCRTVQEERSSVTQPAGRNLAKSPGISKFNGSVDDEYEKAFAQLRNNKLSDAEMAFREFIVHHSDHRLAMNPDCPFAVLQEFDVSHASLFRRRGVVGSNGYH